MMTIQIKLIPITDVKALENLIPMTRMEEYYYDKELAELTDFIISSQSNDLERSVYGFYYKNTLIGFIDITSINSAKQSGYVEGFMIHPDYARMGYGTLLFLRAIEELNLKHLHLCSFHEDCATGFYLSIGFYPKSLNEKNLQAWMRGTLETKMESIDNDQYRRTYSMGNLFFDLDASYCRYFLLNKLQTFSQKSPDHYNLYINYIFPLKFYQNLLNQSEQFDVNTNISLKLKSDEVTIKIKDIHNSIDSETDFNSNSESEMDSDSSEEEMEVEAPKTQAPVSTIQASLRLFQPKHSSIDPDDFLNSKDFVLTERDREDWINLYNKN